MTSPIASLTTSSKRDMCAPFWRGPRSTKHSSLRAEELLAPVGAIRMTFSTPVTPTRESDDVHGRALGLDVRATGVRELPCRTQDTSADCASQSADLCYHSCVG